MTLCAFHQAAGCWLLSESWPALWEVRQTGMVSPQGTVAGQAGGAGGAQADCLLCVANFCRCLFGSRRASTQIALSRMPRSREVTSSIGFIVCPSRVQPRESHWRGASALAASWAQGGKRKSASKWKTKTWWTWRLTRRTGTPSPQMMVLVGPNRSLERHVHPRQRARRRRCPRKRRDEAKKGPMRWSLEMPGRLSGCWILWPKKPKRLCKKEEWTARMSSRRRRKGFWKCWRRQRRSPRSTPRPLRRARSWKTSAWRCSRWRSSLPWWRARHRRSSTWPRSCPTWAMGRFRSLLRRLPDEPMRLTLSELGLYLPYCSCSLRLPVN